MRLASLLACALALPAAANAALASEEVYFTIKLQDARAGAISVSPGGQIQVRSFEWGGTRGTTPYKLDRAFVKSWSTSGDAGGAPPRGGGHNETAMDDTAGKERQAKPGRGIDIAKVDGEIVSPGTGAARGDMVLKGSKVGENAGIGTAIGSASGSWATRGNEDHAATVDRNETITIHGNRTETAGGARAGSGRPLQKGSVWVRVSTPWVACRAGTRYPSLELAGGGQAYVLGDVTVSRCGTAVSPDEVAFSYQTIRFNY